MQNKLAVCGVLGLLALTCVESAAAAENYALQAKEEEKALEDTIKRFVPAYVFVFQDTGGGSGVLISPDGLLLTNYHVTQGKKTLRVRVGKNTYQAETVGNDMRGDIALMKIPNVQNMPYVEFAESDKLVIGQEVIAIGNPFLTAGEGEPTVTVGIISALHRYQGTYSDSIQTDAAINPGNSGGPLLTLDGKLAGINGQIATKTGQKANTGIGLAIPAKQIQRFLPDLKEAAGGSVYHGYIRGLQCTNDENETVKAGAEIKTTKAGSTAEKAGFQKGDKIVSFDGYKVNGLVRLDGVMGTYPAGSTVKVTYQHGTETKTAEIVLDTVNPPAPPFVVDPRRPGPATIMQTPAGKAAEKAGLKAGDRIIGLDDKPVNTFQEFLQAFTDQDPTAGETLKLKVQRGDPKQPQEVEISIVLDSAYDQPPPAQRQRLPKPH